MESWEKLESFLSKSAKDGRISVAHIGLYACLLSFWREQGCKDPLVTFGSKVMPAARISSNATYYRLVNDLNDYGYLRYRRSFSNAEGSQFYL